jgi:sulfite reductase beta subunit-like hemoprotein
MALARTPRNTWQTRPITVRWPGVPPRANHHTADIGLQGWGEWVARSDGVHISWAGRGGHDPRAGTLLMEDVPCDELPQVLERLIRFFPRPERQAPPPDASTPDPPAPDSQTGDAP